VFEGFLPRRGSARRARLAALANEPRTLVLLESTHRVAASLTDLAAGFGADRPAVLCRELTKTYEEILRGTLGELARQAATRELRGEITLVVAGAPQPPAAASPPEDGELALLVEARSAAGSGRREAIAAVAAQAGLSRRAVFDALVRAKAQLPSRS
jgi:16S rRNA (cytidine1402-2'-O)-methyltransferase